jgi:uncharacterized protein YggE
MSTTGFRIPFIVCLALTNAVPALAQSPETMPETLRRLFDSLPTPRLPDSFGLTRAGVIALEGESSIRVRPDAARIRIGVVNEGTSPTAVAQENATRMTGVLEAIKKLVGEAVLSRGTVEIRTDAVTLTPIYAAQQGPRPGTPLVSGYRGNNRTHISIRDLDELSAGLLASIIEHANRAGANEISGPEFLVLKDAKPLVEARVNAIQDARTKAETYAKALNVRLGRVLTVTELERGHRPMPMMARAASPAEASPKQAQTRSLRALR